MISDDIIREAIDAIHRVESGFDGRLESVVDFGHEYELSLHCELPDGVFFLLFEDVNYDPGERVLVVFDRQDRYEVFFLAGAILEGVLYTVGSIAGLRQNWNSEE